jgi:hypothetical protein
VALGEGEAGPAAICLLPAVEAVGEAEVATVAAGEVKEEIYCRH